MKRALTFVELLLVIAIIGVMTAVAVPQIKKTLESYELENFVKDIYYLTYYLQSDAISLGKIHRLNINKDSGEFQADYRDNSQFVNLKGRHGKVFKAPQDITISVEPAERRFVFFYPDGSTDKVSINFTGRNKNKISLVIQGAMNEIKIQ